MRVIVGDSGLCCCVCCVHGPCIAALHVWVALIVPGFVYVCLRSAVEVGSSGVCMHVSCIDSDVHSCLDL